MAGLSLKARLALLVALLVGLQLLLGGMTVWHLGEASRKLDSFYADRLVPAQQLRTIAQLLRAEAPALASQEDAGEATQQRLAQLRREVNELWARYKGTYLVEEERFLIARVEPQLRHAHLLLERLHALLSQADVESRRRFAELDLVPGLRLLGRSLDELIDLQLQVAKREAEASRQTFERSRWHLLFMLLGACLLSAAAAWWLWSRYRRERDEQTEREQRLQRFYVALSQCNQLLLQAPETAQALYETLCRICVETGRARLAAVISVEGNEARRVAAEGPVDSLLADVPAQWALDSAYGQRSLTSQVLRSGQHVVSNDAGLDPRMAHWHASVVARGVPAMAAFPLRRGGQVVAALLIFAGQRGYFEPALVSLLDEMAADITFALDHLDARRQRDAALREAEAERDLFQRLFNASPVTCALTTLAEQRVLEVNEVLCRRYGLSREQMLGRRMGELGAGLLPEDRARYYEALHRDGRVRNLEVRIHDRAGRLRHSLLSGEILDYQGQRCVLSTSVDITELREAQARLSGGGSAPSAPSAQ